MFSATELEMLRFDMLREVTRSWPHLIPYHEQTEPGFDSSHVFSCGMLQSRALLRDVNTSSSPWRSEVEMTVCIRQEMPMDSRRREVGFIISVGETKCVLADLERGL